MKTGLCVSSSRGKSLAIVSLRVISNLKPYTSIIAPCSPVTVLFQSQITSHESPFDALRLLRAGELRHLTTLTPVKDSISIAIVIYGTIVILGGG